MQLVRFPKMRLSRAVSDSTYLAMRYLVRSLNQTWAALGRTFEKADVCRENARDTRAKPLAKGSFPLFSLLWESNFWVLVGAHRRYPLEGSDNQPFGWIDMLRIASSVMLPTLVLNPPTASGNQPMVYLLQHQRPNFLVEDSTRLLSSASLEPPHARG